MMRRSGDEFLFWERFTKSYPIRATALLLITALTVVSCGREGAISRSLDRINYDSLPAEAPRPTTPAEKLQVAASEFGELLALQRERDLSDTQTDRARAARSRIDSALRGLDRQFEADRAKLEKLAARAALARLDAIERRTATLQRSLRLALSEVPEDGGRAVAAAAEAGEILAELAPSKRSQPLSSEFGFGINNGRPRRPSLSAGITPAYSAPTSTSVESELPRTPLEEDLSETPETKATPAVRALAHELDRDPVKIYRHVRNTIRFEPYYGIRKGAEQTLVERAGSDADQAALLIALLRASGIHARFVQGVAELPAATAANWVGVDVSRGERLDAAPEILWAGGIPTTQIRTNGELTKVRFEHIWAEAYVPEDAYRGVGEGQGAKTWLPLDPSMKQTRFGAPRADLHERLGPLARSWSEGVIDASRITDGAAVIAPPSVDAVAATQELVADVKDEIDEAAGEGATVGDLVGRRDLVKASLPYLPSTTPFRTLSVSGEFRAVPRALHASVTLGVSGADPLSVPNPDPEGGEDGFTFSAPTLALVDKRVTVTYVPASSADAEIIDAYHGLLNAPSYAAALIPVLRVDGRVVARGNRAVSTGYTQNFRVTYRMPGFAPDAVENPIYVGGVTSFVLDVGFASGKRLRDRADAWRSGSRDVTEENVLTDAVSGEAMSMLGLAYFNRTDALNAMLAQVSGVHQQRAVSGLVVATDITPSYVASFPVGTRLTGAYMDVDHDAQAVVGRSDANEAPVHYMRASGANSSASEGVVFEKAFGRTGVSTTKVMEVAARQQIPIYSLNQANAGGLLPQLNISPETRAEVFEAVSRPGVTVVIPRDEVDIGGWRGSGYIVYGEDSTGYRIMGGANGGFLSFVDTVNNYTSITYWAKKLGAPAWSVSISNCIGFANDVLGMGLAVWAAEGTAWSLTIVLLESLAAPFMLTGVGLAITVAIFLIIFFAYVFMTVYSAMESGPRCGDDLDDATGG